jgi:transcriptional regulator with XRE-family HTH domain
MPSSPKSDGSGHDGEPNWAALVRLVQDRMYLTQLEIARRCGIARQTVSAWVNGRRSPGLKAKRALLQLVAESDLVVRTAVSSEREVPSSSMLDDAHELGLLMGELSPRARREVLDFVRLKVAWERT